MAELDQLTTDLAPEAAQVVIHGMPGVGKTTLALHYAHSASASYPGGVWWLNASKGFEPMVLEAVTELETRIPGLGAVEGLNLEARLRRCFQNWPGEAAAAVLLVVDNLPPPPEGLEVMGRLTTGLPARFRRLLTQRALPPSSTTALRLPVLASEEALDLLKNRSGESGRLRIAREEEQARELVEEVGRLPLALVLLGGRLELVPSLSVTSLRQDLDGSALQAKAFAKDNADFQGEPGLVATLLTSWATLGSEAMELARLLSLTLPAPIPWELIERCLPSGPPTTPQPVNRYWEDALAELVGANLLDALDGDHPLYGLHPLVRQFFSLQRGGWEPEPNWRRELGAAAQALAQGCQGVHLPRAVDYWRQATHADPADAAAAYGLGYGLIDLGDSEGARQAFEQSRRNAEAANDPRGVAVAWLGFGDVLVSQGNGPEALKAFQAGRTIVEGLAKRDPANTEWQRHLSRSQGKIGDVLVSQGDGPGALAAYQAGLTIAEDLAKRDPANTQWQRDLSVIQVKVGDMLKKQGESHKALDVYKRSLKIRDKLLTHDQTNIEWQRDLSVIHNRIGDLLLLQGNSCGALESYQAELNIVKDLAQRDNSNTKWQRDLSVCHINIGDVLLGEGKGTEALEAFQAAHEIRKTLAKRDSANTQWKRDLSTSLIKTGDVLLKQGKGPKALEAFQEGLSIREGLAKQDPENTEWQVDFAVSCAKLVSTDQLLPISTRRDYLKRGYDILIALKQAGRLNRNQDSTAWFKEQIQRLDAAD